MVLGDSYSRESGCDLVWGGFKNSLAARFALLGSGLFGFLQRFRLVAGRCGHASLFKPRKKPKILAPHGYRILENAPGKLTERGRRARGKGGGLKRTQDWRRVGNCGIRSAKCGMGGQNLRFDREAGMEEAGCKAALQRRCDVSRGEKRCRATAVHIGTGFGRRVASPGQAGRLCYLGQSKEFSHIIYATGS
jgi:hypothetical protein